MPRSTSLRFRKRKRPNLPPPGPAEEMAEAVHGPRRKWNTVIKGNLDLIEGWARRGYTEASIAEQLGISQPTLWRAKQEHSELVEALERGKKDCVVLVENALFREATGYTVTERDTEIAGYNKDGDPIVTKLTLRERQVRPNSGCIMFFLANRKPDRWRHMRTTQLEGGRSPVRISAEGACPPNLRGMGQDKLDMLEGLIKEVLEGREPAQLDE